MEKVDTHIVDKTGTLTAGKPKLTSIRSVGGFGEEALLRLAASLERGSEHPLAVPILAAAGERSLVLTDAQAFDTQPGQGVTGEVDGRSVAIGNSAQMRRLGINVAAVESRADQQRAAGETVMFIAVGGVLADGVEIVMLTGDNRRTADAVARKLEIQQFEAEVQPQQKGDVVRRYRDRGRVVAMAGDGVNDAPALAGADVGIAMGTGTDVAIESATITLVKGDLTGIVRARRLSRATMRNIRQNLFFAFFYNAVGVPIAAGVLYPLFGILIGPIFAAAAMSLSSVSVIGNALRLRSLRL